MTLLFGSIHSIAAIGLYHSIRKNNHHEEEMVTLALVVVIAISSLLSMILDTKGGF